VFLMIRWAGAFSLDRAIAAAETSGTVQRDFAHS
jgi:hypothetical protein